jgi:peptidoglycan/xylan/chitin deacetylase (PgdA/CDA1 family)
VVSLTFDDGDRTQDVAGSLLLSHGMRGTFYVNTGPLDARDPGHMSWAEVLQLAAEGDDIGGHTADHVNLTAADIPAAVKRDEICRDRARLQQMGLPAVSFAYPYGAFDRAAEQMVQSCGYRSARSAGSVSPDRSLEPVDAETMPPRDPFATRVLDGPVDGGPQQPLSLSRLQRAIVVAAEHGNGWIQIAFHRLCAPADPRFDDCMATWAPIDVNTFNAFLDWLQYGAPKGTTVRTVSDVMTQRSN